MEGTLYETLISQHYFAKKKQNVDHSTSNKDVLHFSFLIRIFKDLTF